MLCLAVAGGALSAHWRGVAAVAGRPPYHMAGSDMAVARDARPYQGRRRAVHGAAVSACGSERCVVAHELREIPVDDAVALLDWIVAREDVFWVVVANLLQRSVFSVFSPSLVHHCHARLHVRVAGVTIAKDEIAFQCTDSPYACRIAVGAGVGVYHVFNRRTVVDPIVGVCGEVETEVREIVLLLAADGSAGFKVKAVAFVENLGVFQNADVSVQRFALDVCPSLAKVFKKVVETCGCAEIVDKVCLNLLECGQITDLYAAADVLLEYLCDNTRYVCPAVVGGIVLNSLGKSAVTQVLVELIYEVGRNGLAEKAFHAKELVEGEREHFKFKVSSGQFRDKLAAQKVGVGAGDENGMSAFDAEGIKHFLKTLYILDFIYEEIGRSRRRRPFIDELFKVIRGFDAFVRSAVKIKIDNVCIVYAVFPKFVGNCFHQTGFAAASDASNYFYESSVFIKAANFAEVVFSSVEVHGRQYNIFTAKSQVKGVDVVERLKNTPLTCKFAPCRPHRRVAFRRVADGALSVHWRGVAAVAPRPPYHVAGSDMAVARDARPYQGRRRACTARLGASELGGPLPRVQLLSVAGCPARV